MDDLVKIVITGPESSGKTWLCKELAKHFNCPWIPEYARIYLEKNGPNYNFETFIEIAKEHIQFQQNKLPKKGLVIMDTDMINYSVWAKVVFNIKDNWIESKIENEPDHKYLLTYPDLPWESDPIRENPNDLKMLYSKHLNKLEEYNRPHKKIEKQGKERLNQAIRAVKFFLGS